MAVFADTRAKSSKKIKKSKEMTKEEINSLRVRYAPTMLYPPARAAFERALNAKATSETESPRTEAAAEPPLTGGELAALRALGGGLDAAQLAADARYAAKELRHGVKSNEETRKPAQASVAPRGTLRGTEYPTAPDKGGRGAAESGKNTK